MTSFQTPRFQLLAHGLGAGLLLTAFAGCDQSDSDAGLRSQSHAAYATGSRYDVGVAGYGGRSTADRSTSDPLRYAYYGLPQRAALLPEPLILFNSGSVTGYDTKRQMPLWVCYRLSDQDHGSEHGHSDREHASVQPDPRLGPHQHLPDPKNRDAYVGLPLAPARAILSSYGEAAAAECDDTSNMLPCAAPPGWQQLLDLEPRYARANHELWVITGPLLKDAASTEISGLWKIQVVVQMGKTVTQSFILPEASGGERERNRDGLIDLSAAVTTIAAIAQQTQCTFLPQLHDIDGQSGAEVLNLPSPGVWPAEGMVAAAAAPTTGRR